jgi:cell division protein FtsW
MKRLARTRIPPERTIAVCVFLLCCFGLVMVYSSSAVLGISTSGSSVHFFESQLMKLLVGIVCLICFWHLDYHHLEGRPARIALILVFLSLLVLAFQHYLTGEVCRWHHLGGFTIQPSEFGRIVLVIFLASYLSRNEQRMDGWRLLIVPGAVILGMVALIRCQPNLSMALLVLMLGLGLLFLAGQPVRRLALLAVLPVLAAMIRMQVYQSERWKGFLALLTGREADYQLFQGIKAVGSGGLFGCGLGNGLQKYFFLPFPHTDFILGIVGEEAGLLGITLLFACYGLLIAMGVRTARNAPDRFGTLLVIGLTANLALNVMLHSAVNLGMGPVTGVPLPFLSCGGSSLIANLVAIGIILSVARRSVFARARDWSTIGGFAR